MVILPLRPKNAKDWATLDQEQLTFATQHHYTLFTHNIRDFCELARSLNQKEKTHAGIILAPQWEFSKLLNVTLRMVNDWQNRDPSNHVIWLHSYCNE